MKGVQTMSVANGTAKRFQASTIYADQINISGVELGEVVLKLMEQIKELNLKVKELEDKVNSFEVEK
jgi:hypothetical protein